MSKRIKFIIMVTIIVINTLFDVSIAQVKLWKDSLTKESGNKELLLKLGKYYHKAGGEGGSEEAVLKAEIYLEKLLRLEPGNGLAMVYLGSVITMKARDTILPWKKWDYMQNGFKMIDNGVKTDPGNVEVRLMRAIHSVSVPSFFNRFDIGFRDFEYLSMVISENEIDFSQEFLLPYYYYYGTALEMDEKYQAAKEMFRKTIDVSPDSEYAKMAENELRSLEKK